MVPTGVLIGHHRPWNVRIVVWHHCHPRDIDIFELLVPGALSLSTTAVNKHTPNPLKIGRESGLVTGRLKGGDAHAFRQA